MTSHLDIEAELLRDLERMDAAIDAALSLHERHYENKNGRPGVKMENNPAAAAKMMGERTRALALLQQIRSKPQEWKRPETPQEAREMLRRLDPIVNELRRMAGKETADGTAHSELPVAGVDRGVGPGNDA